MTVAELIAELQKMPGDAHVLHRAVSAVGRSDFREAHSAVIGRCVWNEGDLEYLEAMPNRGELCVVIE